MRGRLFSLNDPGQLLEMRSIGERYILIRKEWNHSLPSSRRLYATSFRR
jgi:hypothetical protein